MPGTDLILGGNGHLSRSVQRREIARSERVMELQAHHSMQRAQLAEGKAQLRQVFAENTITRAGQLVDHAYAITQGDPVKLDLVGQVLQAWAYDEMTRIRRDLG